MNKFKVGDWVKHEKFGIGFVYRSGKLRVSFPFFKDKEDLDTWYYINLEHIDGFGVLEKLYPTFNNIEEVLQTATESMQTKVIDQTTRFSFDEIVRCHGELGFFHGWHVDPVSDILYYKVKIIGTEELKTVLTRNVRKADPDEVLQPGNAKRTIKYGDEEDEACEMKESKFDIGDRVVFKGVFYTREIIEIGGKSLNRCGDSKWRYFMQTNNHSGGGLIEDRVFALNDPEILEVGDKVKVVDEYFFNSSESNQVTISAGREFVITNVCLEWVQLKYSCDKFEARFDIPLSHIELVLD